MKSLAWISLVALLVSCAPSPSSIATAIARTQSAWTPVPTQTPYPTLTPAPTGTPPATLAPASPVLVTVEVTRLVNQPVTVTPASAPSPTAEPTSSPFPSPTLPAFQPTVTPVPFTPLPSAAIIGRHVVQPGETIFCIGRGYGVLPAAIAQANRLSQTFFISPGQVLQIPAVQWLNIAAGPVCATQFASPFPGLVVPTATLAGLPLVVSLNFNCTANCSSTTGTYIIHVDATASGGAQPYAYSPAQSFEVKDLPHCHLGQGTVTVTSADGQVVQKTWAYQDPTCP